jgi:hypothetical protein
MLPVAPETRPIVSGIPLSISFNNMPIVRFSQPQLTASEHPIDGDAPFFDRSMMIEGSLVKRGASKTEWLKCPTP